jgi:hypothetical protein
VTIGAPTARPRSAPASSILDAIRRWNAHYGEPPLLVDWEPSRARGRGQGWRAERYEAGDWPTGRAVRKHFGTMSDAIRAAGLVPRYPRTRRRGVLHATQDVLRAVEVAEPPHPEARSADGQAGMPAPNIPRQQRVLALRVQSVVTAASCDDRRLLVEALKDLAAAAYGWADDIQASSAPGD